MMPFAIALKEGNYDASQHVPDRESHSESFGGNSNISDGKKFHKKGHSVAILLGHVQPPSMAAS